MRDWRGGRCGLGAVPLPGGAGRYLRRLGARVCAEVVGGEAWGRGLSVARSAVGRALEIGGEGVGDRGEASPRRHGDKDAEARSGVGAGRSVGGIRWLS